MRSSRTSLADLGRFSNPSLLILSSLASGPKHGYVMITDIEQFSGTHLEVGTLYGAVARLEKQGWIEPLPMVERRRPYRLTETGKAVLHEQLIIMSRVVSSGFQRLSPA